MNIELLVAILGFAGTAVGSLFGIIINTKLSNYRIEQLEKKVEKHNEVIARTYNLEKEVGEIRTDISHIYHELDEIKK